MLHSITSMVITEIPSLEMLSVGDPLPSVDGMLEVPSMETFICTAGNIRKQKAVAHANLFHMHTCKYGLDGVEALGNYVLRMFVDCESLDCALRVFNRMSYWDEFSWTSLIKGHVEYGDITQAFTLFHEMQESSCLSSYTLSDLLKACVKLDSLERGYKLHLDVSKWGWDIDIGVGGSLMDMYSKCGALSEARQVFEHLPARDVVLWSNLMSGYVEWGYGERALDCLWEMYAEGVRPDAVTYVGCLKACGSVPSIEMGRQIYIEITKGGFEGDLFVGNALVDIHSKCGFPEEAHEIFNRLPCKDAVSWNTLINGYANHGFHKEALSVFESMKFAGVETTPVTIVCGLKACDGTHNLRKGYAIHAQAIEEAFELNQAVGNALVGMYAKCDALLEAQDTFDNLQTQDLVSWTALISGYTENGKDQEALDYLQRMQLEDVSPDTPAYVSGLKACASLQAWDVGLKLHRDIVKEGLENEQFVSNTLIDVYAKCGLLLEAHEVFDSIMDRDVVSWNVLIAGYIDHGYGVEAIDWLNRMQCQGVSPNLVTFICNLKACSLVGDLNKGQRVHSEIVEEGYEMDPFAGNTVIDMYLKCRALLDARDVFDELPSRDTVTWSALLLGCAELGSGNVAPELLGLIQAEGVLSDLKVWDALILCSTQQGDMDSVFNLCVQMQEQCLVPTMATCVSILNACGEIAALRFGKKVHASISRVVLESASAILANALIDMYCQCGSIAEAEQLFEVVPARDVVTWNTLVTGYARQGRSDFGIDVLEKMKDEHIEPVEVTFLSVLMAFNHNGYVEKGKMYFEMIALCYATTSSIKLFHCLANLLVRTGQVSEAASLLERMPFKPDLLTWSTMLGACHRWGHVKLGRKVFEGVTSLEHIQSSAYILMSNMFVEAFLWEE